MPNWAMGDVSITGKKKGIKSFVQRFITEDEPRTLPDKPFFYRSFVYLSRESLLDEVDSEFKRNPDGEETMMLMGVNFAWSARHCLIDCGHENNKRCISLETACIEDGVDVDVSTVEPGMGFEEHITCSRDGVLANETKEMKLARCNHCGATQSVASFEILTEVECCECGEAGFSYCESEEDS